MKSQKYFPAPRPGQWPGFKSALIAAGVFVLILIIWAFRPFTIVNGGYVGVKTFLGAPEQEVLGSGLHLILPIAETIYEVSTQPQLASTTETASTNDQQNVSTGVSVNFAINPTEAVNFWKNYRDIPTLTQTIIAPIVSNDTKAVTAVYNAQELITKREQVRQEIEQDVRADLAQYKVVVVTGVNITNFSYSDAYNQAIDAKQVAQQTALEEQYKLQQVQISAQQQVAQANAQASAAVAIAQGQAKATILQAQADAQAYKLKQEILDERHPFALGDPEMGWAAAAIYGRLRRPALPPTWGCAEVRCCCPLGRQVISARSGHPAGQAVLRRSRSLNSFRTLATFGATTTWQ